MTAPTDEMQPGDAAFAIGFGLAGLSLIPGAVALAWVAALVHMRAFSVEVPSDAATAPMIVAWVAVGMMVASMPIMAVWWRQSRSVRSG